MNGNVFSFLLLSGILILTILGVGGYYSWRIRKASSAGWEELLKRLMTIDQAGVDTVALDAIEPSSGNRRTDSFARELEPDKIWQLLGGLDGVQRLESNSRVLVDMASYLQRSYSEASALAEELRLQAKELEWHVGRLRMAAEQGSLEFHIGTYAQNAAIAYYKMEQRLQDFCQRANAPAFRSLPNSR